MVTPKKKTEDLQKRGRKSEFKPEFVELAFNYALLGATDLQLSEFLGVSERQINRWKKDYPEFCQSLKKGKEKADSEVAQKLFKRAIGYDFDEIHVERKGRKILRKKTINKHQPPEVTAQIFWLKNRQPELWRDKQQIEADVSINQFGDLMKKVSERKSKKDA